MPTGHTPAPVVSVVVPTRDRPTDLGRLLRALARQRTERAFEVVVVDDGSEPPLDSSRLDALPASRLVRVRGGGPAAARNAGAAVAQGEYVLFTDDDTEPAPTWVGAACEFFERHPDHVGVEGPVASPPFDPLYEHSLENDAPGAFWTCNIAYRRQVFDQLGGFFEEFPDPHCEDLDLAFRASRLGGIGFEPGMAIVHFPRPVPLRHWMRRARFARSEALLFQRHPERFGRSARVPVQLFPILSAFYSWSRQFRAQAPQLLRSPRRLARFAAIAGVYTGTVLVTTVRQAARARRSCQ